MSQDTENKPGIHSTPDREIAKTNSQVMADAFKNWRIMTESQKEKWRSFKYRCECPACHMVNFSNDLTKVIIDIPHTDDCDFRKGTPQTFNAEIN